MWFSSWLKKAVIWFAFAMVAVPIAQQIFVTMADEMGLYRNAIGRLRMITTYLLHEWWFPWLAGFLVGAAATMWLGEYLYNKYKISNSARFSAIPLGQDKTSLKLKFEIGQDMPVQIGVENIFQWYFTWNDIFHLRHVNEKGELVTAMISPRQYFIFLVFDHPINIHQLVVRYSKPDETKFEVKKQDSHFAVISGSGRSPDGILDIYASLNPS